MHPRIYIAIGGETFNTPISIPDHVITFFGFRDIILVLGERRIGRTQPF